MSLRDPKAKKPPRLPGRVYTLLVTSLATLLVAIPLVKPSASSWTVEAVVRHPEIQGNDTAQQLALDQLRTASEGLGLLSATNSEAELKTLQSKFASATKPSGDGNFLTSIRFVSSHSKPARDLVSQVAYGLADVAGDPSQVVSIEAVAAGGLPRGKLLAVMMCSFTVGFTTIFFPRRRSRPAESNADKLEQVTSATGLPIIGSVMATPTEKKKKKKSSNFPLRLTAFTAELVVASAFIFTLFGAASDSNLLFQMVKSPLDGYAKSIRTASTQFQSVLQR